MLVENILSQISEENKRFEAIQNKLFNVVKVPLVTGSAVFNAPKEMYGTYRDTGGDALGVVGGDFTPQQPKDLFNLFVDGIMNNPKLTSDEMRYVEMAGASKIRFQTPLGVIKFKNLQGIEDESIVRLNLQTGFDGKTKTSMYLTTYRLICSNGMKATFTEHACSFKNTSGNAGKSVSLIADIQRQLRHSESLEEMYLHLNKVKVNKTQTKDYVGKVLGYDLTEYDDFSTRKQNIVENVLESIDTEFARTGQTAYGLLQGVTHYTNHKASGFENPDYIYLGRGAEVNDKAVKFALELAK